MVVSVIQEGRGVLHFSGELDTYNLELLGEHAANLSAGPRHRGISIALDLGERATLTTEGVRLLNRLAAGGATVSIQSRHKEASV